MAKFYGIVGYADTQQTSPGVWTPNIVEKNYNGDVIRNTKRVENGVSVNDDVRLNNLISIVADAYAIQNFHNMKYVQYNGVFWKIESIEVQRPRLILTIGGVYNGNTLTTPGTP